MSPLWTRNNIIDTERKKIEASVNLIDVVESRIKDMNISWEKKEEIIKRLAGILAKGVGHKDIPNDNGNQKNNIPYKQITTQELPFFLAAANMNLQDFWKVCYKDKKLIELAPEGADPDDPQYQDLDRYIPVEISNLYRTLDGMDEKTRREVGKVAMALTPTFWHSELDEMMTLRKYLGDGNADDVRINPYLTMGPVGRVWALIQRKFSADESLPERIKNAADGSEAKSVLYSLRVRRQGGFHITKLPVICNIFGVSMHHILNMPDEVKLYAKENGTEQIITAYMFMGETNKTIFREMIRKVGTNA